MVFPPKKERRKTVCANKIIENYAPSVIYTSMASANKQQQKEAKRNSCIIEIYCRMSDMVRTSLIDCALLTRRIRLHASINTGIKPEILLLPIIMCATNERAIDQSIDLPSI